MAKRIKLSSPIMDMDTKTVWKAFSMLEESSYSKLYDKYQEAGIPLKRQRTASLLNNCAVNGISTLRALEPKLYDKINVRFNNINFLKDHGKKYYYNIEKPDTKKWTGEYTQSHKDFVKALELPDNVTFDEIDGEGGHRFNFYDNGKRIVYPLDYILKNVSLTEDEKKRAKELNKVPCSWRDYCLYILSTIKNDDIRTNYQNKITSIMLAWRYTEYIVSEATLKALRILCDIDSKITREVINEEWNYDDFYVQVHKKPMLSLTKLPNESLEKEAADCIEYLFKNNMLDSYLSKSEYIKDIYDKSLVDGKFDVAKMRRGTLKENIHSTANWKVFVACILKNDIHMTYAGEVTTFEVNNLKKKYTAK